MPRWTSQVLNFLKLIEDSNIFWILFCDFLVQKVHTDFAVTGDVHHKIDFKMFGPGSVSFRVFLFSKQCSLRSLFKQISLKSVFITRFFLKTFRKIHWGNDKAVYHVMLDFSIGKCNSLDQTNARSRKFCVYDQFLMAHRIINKWRIYQIRAPLPQTTIFCQENGFDHICSSIVR